MAANRNTKGAPGVLLTLSKATLADLVWELAQTAPECRSCDDAFEVWKTIKEHAERLASPADKRAIAKAILRIEALVAAGAEVTASTARLVRKDGAS